MRLWLALPLLLLPLPLAAQEEERGFFGRIFGGDEEVQEEDQGFFGRMFRGSDDAGDGGTFLERQLERMMSGAGREVTVTGFRGALSSEATMAEMTIADDEGVWLTLRDVTLDWNRSALLRRRIEVTELSAGEILLPRRPAPGEQGPDVPSPEAGGFSLPELPVAIEIEQIEAARVVLGEPILGKEATVSLAGSVTLAGGDGAADISAERIDGEEGSLTLAASYDSASSELMLDLDLAEGEDGIVASLIDLPGRPSLELTVSGSGPVADFEAEIALATDDEPRLAGTVSLSEADGGGVGFAADIGGDVAPVFLPEYREFFGPDVELVAAGQTLSGGGMRLDSLRIDANALRLEGQAAVGPDGLPDLIDLSGRIEDAGGQPVLLPISGPPTRVRDVTLDVAFDESVSEDWSLNLVVSGLDREGFDAESVSISGSGQIVAAPERSVTAALDFAAEDLSLADGGAQAAVGEAVTGRAEIAWTEGQPLVLDVLTVDGETYGLDASGQATFGEALNVEGEATVSARDLSAFAGVAGRPLAGTAELSLSGAGDPLGGSFDVAVDGSTQDLAVGVPQVDPLLEGAGTLTLRADRGATGTRIEEFRIETPHLLAAGNGTLATGSSRVDLAASIDDTSLVAATLSGPADLTVSASEVSAGWQFDVDASGSGAEIAAEGTVDYLGLEPVLDATFDITAADLGVFSDLVGRELAGRVTASGETRTSFDARQLSAVADVSGRGLVIGDPRIDPLLDGDVDVSLDAVRSGDVVMLRSFRLSAPDADVSAEGRIDGLMVAPVFDGDVSVASSDLAPFSAIAGRQLGGSVDAQASGVLAFDLSRVDLEVEATAQDLDPGVPGAAEALAGRTTLSAAAKRDGDRIEVERLELSNPQIEVSGQGVASGLDTVPAFDGEVSVTSADLSRFSTVAGRELAGSIDAQASGVVSLDLSQLDLEVEATAQDLDPGVPGAAEALAGRTTLSASARRNGDAIEVERLALSNPQIEVSGQGVASALDAAPAFDGQLSLSAPDLAVFSGLARRDLGGSVDASFDGVAASDLSALDAVLAVRGQDIAVGLPGGPLFPGAMTLDVTAVREGDAITLSELSLDSANLSAEGGGSVTGLDGTPVFDGQLAVAAESLAPFGGLAGRPLGGSVSANVSGTVAADISRFDLTADAVAQNLRVGQEDADRLLAGQTTLTLAATRADGVTTIRQADLDATGLDVAASGTLGEAGADVDVSARLADIGPYAPGFAGPVTLDGTVSESGGVLGLDLDATGPGGIAASAVGTVDTSGPVLDLDIDGRAPLAAVNRFVQPRTLAGTATFDLAVQGPPGLDAVSGTVSTTDARLVAPTFGIVLDSIRATAGLGSGQVSVDANASVRAGGSVGVGGTLDIADLIADLDITLNEAVLQDPELYTTRISGGIAVVGPLRGGGRISGDLVLGETEIRIPSTAAGAGGPIPDITHMNEPGPVRQTRIRAGLLRQSMDGTETLRERQRNAHALDIGISAPNRIFVRGRGLDAELGGSLRVRGTTVDMVPSGQFELVRGRLDILGQRLDLDEGSIRLQGNFVPIIRLVAATDAGDVNVRVVVEGSIREPEISFLSQPELPEDEVLARLLFGQGIDEISPLQAAQLASAVAQLAGRGPGITERLRQNIGLDDLDLTTSEDGGTALRAGKYLSENIYTDIVVDSEGETQLNLNLDVSRSLTVRGGVDNNGDTSLGLFFERDY